MLMLPPPGFTTNSINQQSNQLLGKPGQPAVGNASPALKPSGSALSPNPLAAVAAQQSQLGNLLKLLRGGH